MDRNRLIDQLGAVRRIRREYSDLMAYYREMVPSGTYSYRPPVSGGVRIYAPEAWADRRIRTAEQIKHKRRELTDAVQNMQGLVNRVSMTDRQILIDRYVDDLTWDNIGVKLNKHRTSVKRQHDRAIDQILRGV